MSLQAAALGHEAPQRRLADNRVFAWAHEGLVGLEEDIKQAGVGYRAVWLGPVLGALLPHLLERPSGAQDLYAKSQWLHQGLDASGRLHAAGGHMVTWLAPVLGTLLPHMMKQCDAAWRMPGILSGHMRLNWVKRPAF